MSLPFPSPEWVAAYGKEIKASNGYRAASLEWTHGAVALVVNPQPEIGIPAAVTHSGEGKGRLIPAPARSRGTARPPPRPRGATAPRASRARVARARRPRSPRRPPTPWRRARARGRVPPDGAGCSPSRAGSRWGETAGWPGRRRPRGTTLRSRGRSDPVARSAGPDTTYPPARH